MDKIYNYQGNELNIIGQTDVKPLFNRTFAMIAHRGSFFLGFPENSIPAFTMAKMLGYQYIECDVRATSDSKYVIMHDTSINRTCVNASDQSAISSTVNVASTPLSTLRTNYNLKSDDPRYRTPIPTLEEYLIALRDGESIAMMELEQLSNAQVKDVYDLCVKYLGKGKFVFNSQYYSELDYVRSIDADIDLFYETTSIYGTVSTVDGSTRNKVNNVWYADYTGIHYTPLTAALVETYHNAGMRVFAWTVPSGKLEDLIALGVDGVATNDIPPQMFGGVSSLKKFDKNSLSSDYETDGVVTGGKAIITAGQYFRLPNINGEIGIKCIRICAKGNYTLTTNTKTYADSYANTTINFSKTFNDAALTTHELYMFYTIEVVSGVIVTQPYFNISAIGNTEIHSIDYYDVNIEK